MIIEIVLGQINHSNIKKGQKARRITYKSIARYYAFVGVLRHNFQTEADIVQKLLLKFHAK